MHSDSASPGSGLDGAALKELETLARPGGQLDLRRGDVLVRQGEPSDALYFVISGRFGVYYDGAGEPAAEISQGQVIGEIGFFAGLPRNATVIALRDSTVLRLTREQFQEVSAGSPALLDTLVVALARRLSDRASPGARIPSAARAIAIIWAGGSRASGEFLDLVRSVFGAFARTMFLTPDVVRDHHPGAALDDPLTSAWLNALESEFDFVFYVADESLTDWTKKCVRQADTALLVGCPGAGPSLNASERFALSVLPRPARRLVLVHRARSRIATGTTAWLEPRDVFMHHHVALQDQADMQRLSRFLSGRAVGFVAAGGGALGSAHVGAYQALSEAGAEFDILGGTSVGAAMMAAFACGFDPERVDQGTRNIFVTGRAFRRLTLPRFGLLDHKVFDRALRNEYGDVLIEDLWRPFFALSSNLCTQQPKIQRLGPVWQAVRASASIPGVLPPFFTRDGEMLVDGALMDNVPLAAMKELKTGPNVVVLLKVDYPSTYQVDYETIPGARELLIWLLNPFVRRPMPQAPGILQVIMLSMLANSRRDLALDASDVVIRPELPDDIRFNSWERHTEIFREGHRFTVAWLQARVAEQHPGVLAVMRGTQRSAG